MARPRRALLGHASCGSRGASSSATRPRSPTSSERCCALEAPYSPPRVPSAPWTSTDRGTTIRSSSRSYRSRALARCGRSSTRSPTRSGFSGPSATKPGGRRFDFGYGNPGHHAPVPPSCRARSPGTSPSSRRCRRCARTGGSTEYTHVCDTGEPFVDEFTYDTQFGEGWIRGTLLRRTAKLGDGLLVLVIDVTEQRRMEAELRGFADLADHPRPPGADRRHRAPRHPARAAGGARHPTPPSSASSARAPSAPAGSSTASSPTRGPARCNASPSRSRRSWTRSLRTSARASSRPGATLDVGDSPRGRAAACAACSHGSRTP